MRHKLLSQIISAVMPTRMGRYRVRGLIQYGPVRALKLYMKVRCTENKPPYKLAVCAIAKNEGPYLAEWIEYHNLMGAEKFYIHDNESTDDTKKVLQPYIDSGLVDYTFFPGERMQVAAYERCLEDHRFESEWIAFIDIDEFIVPLRDANIPQFLDGFTDYSVVQINWLCYGSGGQREHLSGLVTERFRDHGQYDDPVNHHVKSIVQPTRVVGFSGAHEAVRLFGKAVTPEKEVVRKHYRDHYDVFGIDIIRVNHYAVKSYEEFKAKRDRGRARPGKRRDDEYFECFDRNEIKKDPTMDKYIPVLKERLAKK